MNANGLYSGLELGAVNGVYNGVNSGVGNGAVSNEANVKLFLLDRTPGAAAAYSLRKLIYRYNGPAIRVRRSSDNLETDIGFDGNGNLNENQLLSFVGVNDGFVSVWYDQSGNNRSVTQSTPSNQSRIVNAGVIEKADSKPAVRFRNGASEFLSNSTTITNTTASIFLVSKLVTTGTNQTRGQFGLASNTAGTYITIYNFSNSIRGAIRNPASNVSERDISYSIAANTTKMYLSSNFIISTTSREYFVDSTSAGTNVATTAAITSDNIVIGKRQTSDANGIDGFISEVIFYSSDESINRLSIEQNINSYYKIY